MTSCAAPAAHAGRTRRRPGRRDSAGALPVRWSVGYPDRPRMPAAGLRRPPSRSARTTWPLWGSSLRAPSVAGDLPPPQRPTRFSQPPATLLSANRGGQADSPMARPARRSVAPRQQHQPGLRAAASSSAEHGRSNQPPDFLAQTWAHCARAAASAIGTTRRRRVWRQCTARVWPRWAA